jgi:hypothetical protein
MPKVNLQKYLIILLYVWNTGMFTQLILRVVISGDSHCPEVLIPPCLSGVRDSDEINHRERFQLAF